jgi:hypothetical protein
MPRTSRALLLAVLLALVIPASALADPAVVERATQGPAGGNGGNSNGGGNGGGQVPPAAFPGVAISGGSVKVKRGVATVKVTCPAAAQGACAGRLTLKLGRRSIGSKAFGIRPGQAAKVRVRISRSAKKRLTKRGRLRVSAGATARDGRGAAVRSPAKKLTLKRSR